MQQRDVHAAATILTNQPRTRNQYISTQIYYFLRNNTSSENVLPADFSSFFPHRGMRRGASRQETPLRMATADGSQLVAEDRLRQVVQIVARGHCGTVSSGRLYRKQVAAPEFGQGEVAGEDIR